ncbi:hypothetical protein NDK47_03860 [Brevibacillus ruminantium]|uniref:Photosynthesis system II assembly factor Ycf48/Hcf136-like domain-containing protein n=1 Tax=Brevibacillus ruminantium TaxID=2950604 RepID=A0ABY4WIB8_9BACL|nr:hypothetical protein [Brevibacillus ruminantium]USG66449.1 hypothetical protein NDK47_03860 [Brevibacillus ruminantium]
MKGLLQWGMILMAWVLLAGCSESGRNKPAPPPVTAASSTGDLTYRDVLQLGGVIHNVSMTSDAQQIWVGTHAGLYSSAGGGLWGLLSPQLEQQDVTGWFVDPKNADLIFAAGKNGVLSSNDRGQSWTQLGKGLPKSAEIRSFAGTREGEQLRLFAFVAGEGIYQSSDAGGEWKLWLPLDQEVYAMDFDPVENRLYVAAQFSLLYHEDGEWKTEVVPDVQQVYSLSVDSQGILAVATDQGIMEKVNGEWKQLDARSPETLIVIAPGAGKYQWVGIGESAFVYTLSDDKWKKWN